MEEILHSLDVVTHYSKHFTSDGMISSSTEGQTLFIRQTPGAWPAGAARSK